MSVFKCSQSPLAVSIILSAILFGAFNREMTQLIFLSFMEIQQPQMFSGQKYMSTLDNYPLVMKYVL